jgi:transposase
MNQIISIDIEAVNEDNLMLTYYLNEESISTLKERRLAKTILLTNQHNWSNEKIVKAYRSQYHVEESLKSMKDIKYNTFRPIRHFTDGNFRVHSYSCVLGLTSASLLNFELNGVGSSMSLRHMLDAFKSLEQIFNLYPGKSNNKKNLSLCYTPLEKQVKDYVKKFDLKNMHSK